MGKSRLDPLIAMKTMEPRLIDELNDRVRQVFAQSPAADLERNLRAMLTALFARLDLVTREEFDVQRHVLLRTREKLTLLESRVSELERELAQRHAAPAKASGPPPL